MQTGPILVSTLNVQDPPRKVNMVEMEVVCRCESQALPDGHVAYANQPLKIKVYEDHVQAVMDLVETELEMLKLAEKNHASKLAAHVRTESEGDAEAAKRAEMTYGGSVPGEFYLLTQRSINPLISAKVLRKDLPPPQQEAEVETNERLVASLVEKLAAVAPEIGRHVAEAIAAKGQQQGGRRN